MRHRMMLAAAALAVTAQGCASLEPEPCSPEWVDWKVERVLGDFTDRHRGLIRDLRGLESRLEDPGPFTMVRLASMADDIPPLVEDFQDRVQPELEAAFQTCGEPGVFLPAFADYLRREGVDDSVVAWISGLGLMIESLERG